MAAPVIPRLFYLSRMAFKDLTGEWTVSLAICLAITAVAAPVLVLIALYSGVITQIYSGLRDDPAAREIRLTATGAARFDDAWFEQVAAWTDVAFVAPSTRYASAQGQVLDLAGEQEARASLIPTGAGDPVFAPDGLVLTDVGDAGLSASLAAKLDAGIGDRLQLEVTRGGSGGEQSALVPVTVTAIARASDFGRDALFLSLALLEDIEDYKNGFGAPLLGVDGDEPPPRRYFPDFRLYAADISDVGPLVQRLSDEPYALSLRAEASRIDFATRLDRSLTLVIGAVGLLGALGLAGGLATIQWSMAARRRRTIAVLSLIGFGKPALVGLPVLQALMLGVAGSLCTVGAAWIFTQLVDALLAQSLGIGATRLGFGAIGLVVALILVVSVIPALSIGLRYSNLEPSNEIRET
ncbi:MAG: ABC transporter permease [Geminicoccaceae bacterium]